MKSKRRSLPIFSKIGYGAGNLGFGIVFQCLAAYLLFYTTAVLGIRGRYIGTIMAVGILWDAITDPLMGYFSDITYSRKWGKRHLYLLFGIFGIAGFNILLWQINPTLTEGAKLMAILALFILLKTALTVYGTPYTALGAELTEDYNERTEIQSYKTIAFLIGLAFPMVAGLILFFRPTLNYPIGQLNPSGYRMMGVFTSLLMVITGIICFLTTYKYRHLQHGEVKKHTTTLKTSSVSFLEALKNKFFLFIFLEYLFVNISSALIGSIGLHVFTYTFNLQSTQISIIMGAFFGASIVSLPFWLSVSKKTDKKPAMMSCIKLSLIASFVFFMAVLFREINILWEIALLPIVAALGFGSGGLIMFPPSMIADTIDYEELTNGYRSEGVYFGALTFGYKIIQSLVLFVVGFLLDLIGFNAAFSRQATHTSLMLGVILCMGSIFSFVMGYYFLSKYDLSKEDISRIQNELKKNLAKEGGE